MSQEYVLSQNDIFSGGRCLPAIVRPTPFLVAGRIRTHKFEGLTRRRRFYLEYEETESCTSYETVIFLPHYQYSPESVRIRQSDGLVTQQDFLHQTLIFVHDSMTMADVNGKRVHWIEICYESDD